MALCDTWWQVVAGCGNWGENSEFYGRLCYFKSGVIGMYSTKPIKVKVSVTLDEDLVEQLRRLAAEDDRQLSSYINIALRNHLRQLQSPNAQ